MLSRRAVVAFLFFVSLSFSSIALPLAQAQAAPAPTTAQLEALTGEYAYPTDPDTPLSFYVVDGKLMVESERRVPTEMLSLIHI